MGACTIGCTGNIFSLFSGAEPSHVTPFAALVTKVGGKGGADADARITTFICGGGGGGWMRLVEISPPARARQRTPQWGRDRV